MKTMSDTACMIYYLVLHCYGLSKSLRKKINVSNQGNGGTLSSTALSEPNTGILFFIIVEIYPLILQKASAPCDVLKLPDIFCCIVIIPISLSA